MEIVKSPNKWWNKGEECDISQKWYGMHIYLQQIWPKDNVQADIKIIGAWNWIIKAENREEWYN